MLFIVFIIGLFVGSFLNVVGLRFSVENNRFNLLTPARSHCPYCHMALEILALLPVIGFLYLKGRCQDCQEKISWQYPIVELITGLISVLIYIGFDLTFEAIFYWLLLCFLVPLFIIDFQQQILPDKLTLPLMWLGLIFQMNFGNLQDGVVGVMLGYLTLWGIYWLFKLTTKKEGMGYGDFKLSAAIGAWLGWQALPSLFLVSSILGILLFVLRPRMANAEMAFGPFLIIAFVIIIYKQSVFF